MNENEQTAYRQAHQRVQELKSFYSHLAVYVIGNLGLFLINILTTPDILWFLWALIGWGIGLGLHAFWLFAADRFFGKDWEERQIRRILDKEKQS
jgi:hypothetical protein